MISQQTLQNNYHRQTTEHSQFDIYPDKLVEADSQLKLV